MFFLQLNGLENKKPESGNPETMKKTETLAKTGGVLILMVGCKLENLKSNVKTM